MSAIKRLIENILACDTCYGKGFMGWVSPDGDYDFEYCECNPQNLILEGSEVIF
jgi:hypothetical protein